MGIVLTQPSLTPTTGGGGFPPNLQVRNINGQDILTLQDASRGNKFLSVAENNYTFSEARVNNKDWIQIGTAKSAGAGLIAELNGTIVYASGNCDSVNNNDKEIHLFINNNDVGVIGTFTGPINSSFFNTSLNIDVNQGDLIRLRAYDINTGKIRDVTIKITIKWRG